jgi:hypothetical protein
MISAIVLSMLALAQHPAKPVIEAAATPEMDRLAKVFVGDWNSVESMESGEFFPTEADVTGSRTGGSV